MENKSKSSSPGTVEKIIKSPYTEEPEKVQISVEGADHLYREIRVLFSSAAQGEVAAC